MSLKIAVEGCCHGMLNNIYKVLPPDIDLLIICGDFQAIRNRTDLKTMAVPDKYKHIQDFHQYYSGEKTAPVLTIFIGGNHECLSYLRELKYGGWVAPNIYYIGESGAVWYRGIKIAGISGIYNPQSYFANSLGKEERLPYNRSVIRTIYHVKPRNYLKCLLNTGVAPDIVVSHDWPQNVWKWGNLGQLLRAKKFFKADIESGKLGSPVNRALLDSLRPRYWFSAHLHTRFTAMVVHKSLKQNRYKKEVDTKNTEEISMDMDDTAPVESDKKENTNEIALDMDQEFVTVSNADEILLDMDDMCSIPVAKIASPSQNAKIASPRQNTKTSFLALDKCLPGRKFLEVLDISIERDHPSIHDKDHLFYDAHAVAIDRIVDKFTATEAWKSVSPGNLLTPDHSAVKQLLEELHSEIDHSLGNPGPIPENFKVVAPTSHQQPPKLQYWYNNQTEEYCARFGIPYEKLAL